MADRIILSSRAKEIGLESQAWDSIKAVSDLPAMIFGMRNVLHLAASFSPLIVLVPKKFTDDTIRRDHLLAVRLIPPIPVHWLIVCLSMPFPLEIRGQRFWKASKIDCGEWYLASRQVNL